DRAWPDQGHLGDGPRIRRSHRERASVRQTSGRVAEGRATSPKQVRRREDLRVELVGVSGSLARSRDEDPRIGKQEGGRVIDPVDRVGRERLPGPGSGIPDFGLVYRAGYIVHSRSGGTAGDQNLTGRQ